MAQSAYENSTFLDRLLIRPRLYGTFDEQVPHMGLAELLRPFLWASEQWWCPWLTILLYLLTVKVLHFFTKGTKRKYQWLTIVHNFLLMLESVYILVMHSREIFLFVRDNGLGYWGLYCDPHHLLDGDSDLRFYQSLFYLSKYHELFDTVIVVLRGRSPSMLQLFHHTIMLLVTYYNRWPYLLPAMWLSVWLNLLVHVYMYGYFALRAAGFELSWARRYITSCQIAQFWVILVHALPWPYFHSHYNCLGHIQSWFWVVGPVLYINLMFLQFFLSSSYDSGESNSKQKDE